VVEAPLVAGIEEEHHRISRGHRAAIQIAEVFGKTWAERVITSTGGFQASKNPGCLDGGRQLVLGHIGQPHRLECLVGNARYEGDDEAGPGEWVIAGPAEPDSDVVALKGFMQVHQECLSGLAVPEDEKSLAVPGAGNVVRVFSV
jgi:hypothetical protein